MKENAVTKYLKRFYPRMLHREFAKKMGFTVSRLRICLTGSGCFRGWELLRMYNRTGGAVTPGDLGHEKLQKELDLLVENVKAEKENR